jgi:hypothetical protein
VTARAIADAVNHFKTKAKEKTAKSYGSSCITKRVGADTWLLMPSQLLISANVGAIADDANHFKMKAKDKAVGRRGSFL